MRKLKIARQNNFELPNVPSELKFIEKLAGQYANSKKDLEQYYLLGIKINEDLKLKYTETDYKKILLWTLRQKLISESKNK